jgi:hypothetical protein
MTARLYREFVLSGPAVWQLVKELVREHAKAHIDRGAPLHVIITEYDKRRADVQNREYWGYVLRPISEQVFVEGRKFIPDAWHELYASQYCPKIEITLPNGEIITRRKSTSEMGQKEFREYMDRVRSDAATEHGVVFPSEFEA